jgi:hypothetical protein
MKTPAPSFHDAMLAAHARLDRLRHDGATALQLLRTQPTEFGWVIVYRIGSGPEEAFRVEPDGVGLRVVALERWRTLPSGHAAPLGDGTQPSRSHESPGGSGPPACHQPDGSSKA